MSEFDESAFLEWLEEDVDGYYVSPERVEKEFPKFHEQYKLIGVTSKYDPENDTIDTPVRDYRRAVIHGRVLD